MKTPTILYGPEGKTVLIDALEIPEYWAKGFRDDPTLVGIDEGPATRDELEQKASELGIKFDGRTTDKKLSEKIEEALSAKETSTD